MRRWSTHLWLVAVIAVLPGLRVLCTETCEVDTAVSRTESRGSSPSCHDDDDAPAPDDEGCSHGDMSSTSSLQAHRKQVGDDGSNLTCEVAVPLLIEPPVYPAVATPPAAPITNGLTLGAFFLPLRR